MVVHISTGVVLVTDEKANVNYDNFLELLRGDKDG